MTPTPDDIRELVAPLARLEGALLPMLHRIQETWGYIPDGTHEEIAGLLNISKAEVHGVISFYHDFRAAPAGRKVLKICRAEACRSVGGEELAAAALARHGLDWHATTPDGALTVEPVYCLGLCACGPNAMLGDEPRARLDAAGYDALIAEARA